MSSYIKYIFTFYFLFNVSFGLLLAGPERYSHMDIFKKSKVQLQGPNAELVFSSKNELIAKAEYTYNAKKQLIKSKFWSYNEYTGYSVYNYQKGHLFKEVTYNHKNNPVEKIYYKKNKNNNIIQYEIHSASGKKIATWNFNYAPNKIVESGKRVVDQQITESFVMKQSKKNYWMQTIQLGESGKKVNTFIEYFWKNLQIQKKIKTNFIGKSMMYYHYDPHQRLKEIQFHIKKVNSENFEHTKKHVFKY